MKIKRVTVAVDEQDAGIVFEFADGRIGRAIGPIDPKVRDLVLASAAQTLERAVQELGSSGENLEPAAVTSALMKLRFIRQEALLAEKRVAEALLAMKR